MKHSVRIGIIGDYNPQYLNHVATDEAVRHAAKALTVSHETVWLPTPSLEGKQGIDSLAKMDGLWCSPGSPYVSMDGALRAIRFAREEGVPFIGTCGGFQHAVLDYARNVAGIDGAEHQETAPAGSRMVIHKLACSLAGQTHAVKIFPGTQAHLAYGKKEYEERFFCSFGLNPEYRNILDQGQLQLSGVSDDGQARIVELSGHPFFIATLFVPQALSREDHPHPLIVAFIKAALSS